MFQLSELQDCWIFFAILNFSLYYNILIKFIIWYVFQFLMQKQTDLWLSVCKESICSCLLGCWHLCYLAEASSLNRSYQIWPFSLILLTRKGQRISLMKTKKAHKFEMEYTSSSNFPIITTKMKIACVKLLLVLF